jgi:hypothetical protein
MNNKKEVHILDQMLERLHQFYPDFIGQNPVTWPYLHAWETIGKANTPVLWNLQSIWRAKTNCHYEQNILSQCTLKGSRKESYFCSMGWSNLGKSNL